MDSMRWDGGDPPHPVIELPNGDVWLATTDAPAGRLFRRHLGHVVEVFDGGRIRRVGAGLRYTRPWLLADGPLEVVIERALVDGGLGIAADEVVRDGPRQPPELPEPGLGTGMGLGLGLFGRLAALLHRRDAAASRADPAGWRDTRPWSGTG